MACPPAALICATVSCAEAAAKSATATRAPSRAKVRAVARPMPPPPPVTSATFPSTIPVMAVLILARFSLKGATIPRCRFAGEAIRYTRGVGGTVRGWGMPGVWRSAAWLMLMMLIGLAQPGRAETDTLRVLRPVDLATLPLLIAEHEKLIEKQAEARGLKAPAIRWSAPGKTGPLDSLTAGQADLAATDILPFLLAADTNPGTPQQVRGIAALAQRPYVLVTR